MNPTPEQGAVIKQAVEWHQRLREGELDQAARREFTRWLEASPAHFQELAQICALDVLLQGPMKKGVPRSQASNVINFDSYASVSRPRPQPRQMTSATMRFPARKFAMAASVVLAALAMVLSSFVQTDQVIVTNQGRWDKQLLEDGTVVYAGPRTKLSFHFNDQTRAVTLVRGEALFEVAKEPGRPFIVTTDAGTVQAVGTEFATADLGDTVIVTVAEGKVVVTPTAIRDDGMQPMTPVAAGQQVVLSPTGTSAPVAVDTDRELKWIRDWYEYDGERVSDIVAQLNLRHDVQVIVDDPQVARLRMNSLSFKPSQPEDFVSKINRWYEDFPDKTGGRSAAKVLHLERP
jgi:transmembrane sensor